MFEVSIPKISGEEMMKRYKQIKPVITVNGKLHYFLEYTLEELRDIRCSYINTTSHSFPPFIKIREILKYFSYVSSQISKMYSLKLKFFQKLCNFFNIVLLIMFFNIKRLI
jgi:hypothetical protein